MKSPFCIDFPITLAEMAEIPSYVVYMVFCATVTIGFFLVILLVVLKQYRRCPPNRLLVVYGKTPDGRPRIISHGGVFVFPLLQDSAYLDLHPIQVDLADSSLPADSGAASGIEIPHSYTVAIGTEPKVMDTAVMRLLGLDQDEIRKLARDAIKKAVSTVREITVVLGVPLSLGGL